MKVAIVMVKWSNCFHFLDVTAASLPRLFDHYREGDGQGQQVFRKRDSSGSFRPAWRTARQRTSALMLTALMVSQSLWEERGCGTSLSSSPTMGDRLTAGLRSRLGRSVSASDKDHSSNVPLRYNDFDLCVEPSGLRMAFRDVMVVR